MSHGSNTKEGGVTGRRQTPVVGSGSSDGHQGFWLKIQWLHNLFIGVCVLLSMSEDPLALHCVDWFLYGSNSPKREFTLIYGHNRAAGSEIIEKRG